jgi:phytoene desaturase
VTQRVVVIGGGIGGLSAAIHLAAAGAHVTVLEQNAAVGGKMSEIAQDGFRWDTGPSVITMRPVFEALFAAAGRNLRDYLTLLPVDPLTRYFYPDGTVLDAAQDARVMTERIAAMAGSADAEGYRRYLAYARRIHDITGPRFIYGPPPGLLTLARTPLRDMPAVDPLRTMDASIRRFVADPRLRQLLGRFATYVGASPFLAPATLNVIAHVELSGGVWYPQGGVYAIARALERLARELGVAVRVRTPVQAITTQGGRVTGVRLADGELVNADAVIANVDVATVYERLLPTTPETRKRLAQIVKPGTSCSGFVLLLGIEGEHSRLAHHNILFNRDYEREFDDIFERGVPPQDPTVYISITSKTDPGHAPPGCENWFVLVNAPPLGQAFDWTREAAAYRNRVLERMAAFGFEVRGTIRSERMLTPHDLERMTGARRGALYGISSNDRFNALRRPHNRAPDVRGLFFCGGTAHPGGGVPMVTLSGKAAAEMVLKEL